jgi:hypothetical protein
MQNTLSRRIYRKSKGAGAGFEKEDGEVLSGLPAADQI